MKKFIVKSVRKFIDMISVKKDDPYGPLGVQFAEINDSLMSIESSLHEHSFAVAARFKESEDSLAKLVTKCSVMENRIDEVLNERDSFRKHSDYSNDANVMTLVATEGFTYKGDWKVGIPTHFPSHVILRVVDCTQKTRPEFWFRMHSSCQIDELMRAYCERTKQQLGTVRFIFEGSWYNGTDLIDSPNGLYIEDGDTIHAIPWREKDELKIERTVLSRSMLELVGG